MRAAFAAEDVLSQDTPLPSSGSDEDFVKISQRDVMGDDNVESIALPTMGTDFKVH